MDQMKWRTLPSRCSYLKLFQSLVLAGLFHFASGIITHVTKPVNDMMKLSCGYNISTDELIRVRIYWQKNNDMVLSVISGKEKSWPAYKNRTTVNIISNPFIMILGLRPSDEGLYSCVIQKPEKKGTYKLAHLTKVMLSVTADFHVPNITELGNPATNIKRIICSTSGGFPKPHLSWLEKGKELNAISTTVFQDLQTELYTISSELDFNVTNNHNFTCLVKYGNLTVSQIFNWQKSQPAPFPFNQSWLWILIPVGIFVIFVIAVFYWQLCNILMDIDSCHLSHSILTQQHHH
uniref:CD80 molecule n=1 Tax=Pipistrellus kuhlii TaxID=59472 RepID=A0A7J8A5Q6_PIPKU|nr:CD80 molecule [Pipistrellus kuhlii]